MQRLVILIVDNTERYAKNGDHISTRVLRDARCLHCVAGNVGWSGVDVACDEIFGGAVWPVDMSCVSYYDLISVPALHHIASYRWHRRYP